MTYQEYSVTHMSECAPILPPPDIDLDPLFNDEKTAREYFESVRWPKGVKCPHCGTARPYKLETQRTGLYRCRNKKCRGQQFTVTSGTSLSRNKVPLNIWLKAICLVTGGKTTVHQLVVDLGVSYKIAWKMRKKIRATVKSLDDIGKLGGPEGAPPSLEQLIKKLLGVFTSGNSGPIKSEEHLSAGRQKVRPLRILIVDAIINKGPMSAAQVGEAIGVPSDNCAQSIYTMVHDELLSAEKPEKGPKVYSATDTGFQYYDKHKHKLNAKTSRRPKRTLPPPERIGAIQGAPNFSETAEELTNAASRLLAENSELRNLLVQVYTLIGKSLGLGESKDGTSS